MKRLPTGTDAADASPDRVGFRVGWSMSRVLQSSLPIAVTIRLWLLAELVLGTFLSVGSARADLATYRDGSPVPFGEGIYGGAEDVWLFRNSLADDTDDRNTGADPRVVLGGVSSMGFVRHQLIRFDVTSLAGKYGSINRVTLRLHWQTPASSATANDVVRVFRVAPANAAWVEGSGGPGVVSNQPWSCWNFRLFSTGAAWAGSGGMNLAGTDYLEAILAATAYDRSEAANASFDLVFTDTSFIEDWVAGTNSGLLLRTATDNAGQILFHSSEAATVALRPQLIIDYDPPAPEIVVEEPEGNDLADGSGSIDFGSVAMGGSLVKTVKIRNVGTAGLDGLDVDPGGGHAGDFAVGSLGATALLPGASTTFTITFSPQAPGDRSSAIAIASNDGDENPFNLALSGSGTGPEIVVEGHDGANLADGAGTIDFGEIVPGGTTAKTLTIRNTGNADLTLFAPTSGGSHSSEFTPGALGSGTVAAGASTTFTVNFSPSGPGARAGSLQIRSNDGDEDPFDLSLVGGGLAAEISVEHPEGVGLVEGEGTIPFGNVVMGASLQKAVVIRNTGSLDLGVSGLSLEGDHPGDFRITGLGTNSIAPGGHTTFFVSFLPRQPGTRNAVLSIANDDANENPFRVKLTGSGTGPEIAVEDPSGNNLSDGGLFGFGNLNFGTSSTKTLTIRNVGTDVLEGLAISKEGSNPDDFSTGELSTQSLAPGETVTLEVTFEPKNSNGRSAILRIASNDTNENPFDIQIGGYCSAAEITVTHDSQVPLTSGTSAIAFGAVGVGATAGKCFRIANYNNGSGIPLEVAMSIAGADAGDFSTIGPRTTITSDDYFLVYFKPTSPGPKTATLLIASNDPDENPFTIALSGNGVAAPLGGAFDDTFGNRGRAIADMTGLTAGESMVVDPDGRIVIAGTSFLSSPDFAVARFLPDGSLDPSFDGDGMKKIDLSGSYSYDELKSICRQADGKYLLAGRMIIDSGSWNTASWAIIRLNRDGSLDTTFDGDGKVFTEIGTQQAEVAEDIAVQADGKILVVGHDMENPESKVVAVRYHADGRLDTAFGSGGRVFLEPGEYMKRAYGVAVQSDGRIVIVGSTVSNGHNRFLAIRLLPDGSPDPSFGEQGIVQVVTETGGGEAREVILQGDGKIILVGRFLGDQIGYFGLARLNPDGSPDTSFGGDGVSTHSSGGVLDLGFDGVLQADGRIVMAGWVIRDGYWCFGVSRVNPDGTPDTTFDLDGTLSLPVVPRNSVSTCLGLQADGRILVGGYVTDSAEVNYSVGMGIIRLHAGVSLPDISVEQETGADLADGIVTVDFGSTLAETPVSRTFTVRNAGSAPLTGLDVEAVGPGAAEFTVGDLESDTLAPGASTTIEVTFEASDAESEGTSLRITSNDANESPFDIVLAATVVSGQESWREFHFGTTENEGDAADSADPDFDGLDNRFEYAFGLDPRSGSSNLLPQPGFADGFYTIRFEQPPGATGVVYGAQWSATLAPGSWIDLPDSGIENVHEFRVPVGSNKSLFMRLKVGLAR